MAIKKTRLLNPPGKVFCPECREECLLISYDVDRLVFRHAIANECANKSKVWALKQPYIIADEL